MQHYCKTLYFRCILISRFWNVEISLHFNLAFAQCSTSIYQAFDEQTEFSRVFNYAILFYSRNSRKFDAREKCVFYNISCLAVAGISMLKNGTVTKFCHFALEAPVIVSSCRYSSRLNQYNPTEILTNLRLKFCHGLQTQQLPVVVIFLDV